MLSDRVIKSGGMRRPLSICGYSVHLLSQSTKDATKHPTRTSIPLLLCLEIALHSLRDIKQTQDSVLKGWRVCIGIGGGLLNRNIRRVSTGNTGRLLVGKTGCFNWNTHTARCLPGAGDTHPTSAVFCCRRDSILNQHPNSA